MPLAEQRDSTSPAPSRPEPGPLPPLQASSALNLPNIITLSRLVLAVFLFWLIDIEGHWLAATVLFVIAAATDAIDGYIARRYGLVTKIGRIFDPFVDKVIVGGAFLFLAVVPVSRGEIVSPGVTTPIATKCDEASRIAACAVTNILSDSRNAFPRAGAVPTGTTALRSGARPWAWGLLLTQLVACVSMCSALRADE